jgi:hypothetical protein
MTEWEELMAEDWRVIEAMLPDGWEKQAEELGAWERVRGFRSKEVLLRTLLIHIAHECSLKETAARAREADLADVSSVALFKRLKKCGEWLRWLALGVVEKWLAPSIQSLHSMELPLKIVDGTTVQEPGAKGTSWRVHYAIRLPSMTCEEFKITSPTEGESLHHFSVNPGDIVLGDRAYAYRGQIASVVRSGGDVIVRTGLSNLPSSDKRGRPFNVLAHIRSLRNGEVGDWDVSFEHGGTAVKGRICAVRKSLAARRAARARCLRENSKKGRKVKPETLEAAEYVIVFTTLHLGFTAETIMEIYRCRWQVELTFKRLKSILGLGNLKKFDPEAARAWLHGKLLTAALIQALIVAGRSFSPWGFAFGNRLVLRPVHMEGNHPHEEIPSSGHHSLDRDRMVHTKLEEHFTETQRGVPEAKIPNGKTHEYHLPNGIS